MAGTLNAGTVNADNYGLANGQALAKCYAMLNYNGVTPGIRASVNVSSVTKNGTGDYTVNFSNALPDANYSVSHSSINTGGVLTQSADNTTPRTTTAFRMLTVSSGFAVTDASVVNLNVMR